MGSGPLLSIMRLMMVCERLLRSFIFVSPTCRLCSPAAAPTAARSGGPPRGGSAGWVCGAHAAGRGQGECASATDEPRARAPRMASKSASRRSLLHIARRGVGARAGLGGLVRPGARSDAASATGHSAGRLVALADLGDGAALHEQIADHLVVHLEGRQGGGCGHTFLGAMAVCTGHAPRPPPPVPWLRTPPRHAQLLATVAPVNSGTARAAQACARVAPTPRAPGHAPRCTARTGGSRGSPSPRWSRRSGSWPSGARRASRLGPTSCRSCRRRSARRRRRSRWSRQNAQDEGWAWPPSRRAARWCYQC